MSKEGGIKCVRFFIVFTTKKTLVVQHKCEISVP